MNWGISLQMDGYGTGEHKSVICKFSSQPDFHKLLETFVNKENTFYQSLHSKLSHL
jgi:hypothetical protein